MAKQDFFRPSLEILYIYFLTIDFYSPGCLESAGWTLVNFERFLKMSKIQDGCQRPF